MSGASVVKTPDCNLKISRMKSQTEPMVGTSTDELSSHERQKQNRLASPKKQESPFCSPDISCLVTFFFYYYSLYTLNPSD